MTEDDDDDSYEFKLFPFYDNVCKSVTWSVVDKM